MSLEDALTGAFKKARRQSNARHTYRFSAKLQWLAENKAPARWLTRHASKMAVRQPFQRDFPALPVDEFRRRASRDHHADGTHRHAGTLRGLRERLDAILRRPCTGSRNRRRRRSTLRSRQCRATPDPAPHPTAGSTPDRSPRRRRTRRRAWRDRRRDHRTHPSPHWHDSRTISASAMRGCGTR